MTSGPRPRRRPGRRAAGLLARVIDCAAWVGCRVPVGVAHRLAAVGGTLEWALRPGKRRRLGENLAHALERRPTDPHVRRTVRREFRNEAHRSADLLWALGRPDEFLATATTVDIHHAQDVLARGSGMVLVGTHLGGWEVATSIPAAYLPSRTHVVVADDWLAWAIEHARTAMGLHVLYAHRATLAGVRALRRGECLLLLGDDGSFSARTHRVRFLDAEADLPAGPVTLARLAKVPIVSFHVLPEGWRRWRITVDPAIAPPTSPTDERRVLQTLADRWSDQIEAAPDHWAASFPVRWSGTDR